MSTSTFLLTTLLEGNDNKEIRDSLCDNIDVLFFK